MPLTREQRELVVKALQSLPSVYVEDLPVVRLDHVLALFTEPTGDVKVGELLATALMASTGKMVDPNEANIGVAVRIRFGANRDEIGRLIGMAVQKITDEYQRQFNIWIRPKGQG